MRDLELGICCFNGNSTRTICCEAPGGTLCKAAPGVPSRGLVGDDVVTLAIILRIRNEMPPDYYSLLLEAGQKAARKSPGSQLAPESNRVWRPQARQSPSCPASFLGCPRQRERPASAMDMGGLDNLIANTAYLQPGEVGPPYSTLAILRSLFLKASLFSEACHPGPPRPFEVPSPVPPAFTSSPPLLSQVCAVQVKNTGKMYACKKLDKKRLKKKGGEKMALLEKEILEKVNSPFIVSLAYAFESKTHLCLVMSLMNGGDLKFHIYNVGTRGLAMSRVIFYTAQMTCGVLHLHGLGIVYRDLKPENVLLDDLGNCRLSDLGLAVEVQDDKPITQRAGTNGYMAPEILMDKASYSYPVDWFAMGCSIYEMVAGRTPFKDFKEKVSKEDLKERTMKDEVAFHHENFTEETKDICRLFLAKKPEQRLGSREKADDPRKHPFFQTVNFPRLEAGLVEPPFVPDPSVVYAKDVDEIDDFSEVRGVEFDDKDKQFFQRFSTGAVPVAWQEEIIETGLFEELNDPNRPSGDGKGDSSKSGVCLLL
ncbi:rhodopsin kinase GRK7 [Marmota marmota marmota]|uniref:rhodopsin kinase GRK7 n=1 Tax=Marmota marmota marmota TaxID=9994 RepID=UPI002093D0AF|nr:rhodopsin kinase GRK7 [Marmota marmota marmota]